jgi:hypothetical protein
MNAGLQSVERHTRPLHGVLGWWAVMSFGLVSVLVAALAALWPAPVRLLGAAGVGTWLLFTACGRFGGGEVLRARYGGPLTLQAGPALVTLAGVILIRLPGLDPKTAVAVAALAFGIAAAGDAAAAQPLAGPARLCLRVRAGSGLVAALAIAASPVSGLIVAAACVGVVEVALALRLLPEVERLMQPAGPRDTLSDVLAEAAERGDV